MTGTVGEGFEITKLTVRIFVDDCPGLVREGGSDAVLGIREG